MIRTLADDTLLVILSDCHIGGSDDRDIFESPNDLVRLLEELDGHSGPVELVLAGDFFDFLRIASVPDGINRAAATISRPEYTALFACLRRFASGKGRNVVYLPGNHDAETWWNPEIRAELRTGGLVDEFALSYAASFQSAPERLVYCEHGNEFDADNAIIDYTDRLDTPLGYHIVTEVIPLLPGGWVADALQLNEIEHVFPLATIPRWVAGRLFYALVTQALRWLLIPLLVAYLAYDAVSYAMGFRGGPVNRMFTDFTYDIALLVGAFALFFVVAGRIADRAIRAAPGRGRAGGVPGSAVEAATIRGRLESGTPPPLGRDLDGEIAVFVSGHTHAPSLETFRRPSGGNGAIVNSGCWLRQLHALRTRLGAPTVFVSRFVQTHVRIQLKGGELDVALWEHPRPAEQRFRVVERLLISGGMPVEPAADSPPRIRAETKV